MKYRSNSTFKSVSDFWATLYLKQQLLKNNFEVKRYGKGPLVQIKEKEMYKILIDRAFTEDEDSPIKKNRAPYSVGHNI